MKDLDFDELDKAVSSLMGATPSGPVEGEKQTESTETQPAAPAPALAEAPVVPVTPEPDTPVAPMPAATTPSPAPAMKRSGRFMDVVHPSSNMKPRSTAVSTNPSRVGVNITPRNDAPAPEVPVETIPPVATIAPEPVQTPATDWPDPLDVSSVEPTPPTPAEVPPLEPVQEPAATVDSSVETTPESVENSNTTPFLSNTTVEKRPLGGSAQTETPDLLSLAEAEQHDEAKLSDDGSAKDQLTPSVVPAELHGDILAVESNAAALSEADMPQLTPEAKSTPEVADAPAPEPKKQDDHVSGAASIAQQYKEQQSTGDQSHTAIYDTAGYAEPLAHPVKKKSGWLWVLWVVLLLAVGAGGAVALYLMGII